MNLTFINSEIIQNSKFVLGAVSGTLPTLDGLKSYVTTQGGNAAAIVFVIAAVIFLFKQEIGKMIGFFVIAAFVYFGVAHVDATLQALSMIAQKIFGG